MMAFHLVFLLQIAEKIKQQKLFKFIVRFIAQHYVRWKRQGYNKTVRHMYFCYTHVRTLK